MILQDLKILLIKITMSLAKYGFITTKVVKIESKISEPQPIPAVKIEAKDVSSVAEQTQDIRRERLNEKIEDPKKLKVPRSCP